MKYLVLGAGKVGCEIAKTLSMADNDVSVVDISISNIKRIEEKLDVKPVLGDATDINVLKEAGIEETDYLIAVTSSDEVNLITCEIVNFMPKVPIKIAKINKSSYFENQDLLSKNKFALDLAIFPRIEISEIIKKSILIPEALNVISCINNEYRIIGFNCKKNAPLSNIQLKHIYSIVKDFEIVIICLQRENKLIIPSKSDYINAGDNVYFLVSQENVYKAMQLLGFNRNKYANVIIIGGGNICEEIARHIDENNIDIQIQIIENDAKQVEILAEKFDKIDILCGNPLEKEVLDIKEMKNAGLVVSMTEDDKVNMLSGLIAKKCGAKRVFTILNNSSYSDLIYSSLGSNTILDSKQIVISKILYFIKQGSTELLLNFEEDAEVILVNVFDNSHIVGSLTDDISTDGEVLIIAIHRGKETYLLPKKKLINGGDKILLISKKSALDWLMKLLQRKPKYLS
ncbi:MAG: Trk system potassium transporter TrkA [Holosporales bacterium]|jgi:trk system potassium uptake protein TrkA|nr:Trk system potassium transporter TrkA [Holosporales bacterium]